eukprot:15679430-Heterocapsa_arctica.AAC.1
MGKLPGYLSCPAGLKFDAVLNNLATISKVPAVGWAPRKQAARLPASVRWREVRDGAELPGCHHFGDFTGKLPGYLSRSAGRKFAAVLNYLAAIIFGEFTIKLPGYLSRSAGVKFKAMLNYWCRSAGLKISAVPNYLAAIIFAELTVKLPGYSSRSAGLKIAAVLNYLATIIR